MDCRDKKAVCSILAAQKLVSIFNGVGYAVILLCISWYFVDFTEVIN